MRAPQEGHREGGWTTDWSRGMRWMHTFAKLPTTRPKRRAVASTNGEDVQTSANPEIGVTGADLPASSGGSQGRVSSRAMRPPWARLALPPLVLGVVAPFLFAILAPPGGRAAPPGV